MLAPDPPPVALTPVLAGDVDSAVAVEELQEPVAPAEDVAAHGLAAAQQIPPRLFGLVWDMDRRQLARAEEPDQFGGVAAIGLDPLAGAPRGQRRGDHLTRHLKGRDLPVEIVARDPRLVARLDRPLAPEALEQAPDEGRLLGQLTQFGLRLARPQDPRDDLPLAVIQRHVRSTLVHDRPPFACGSVPRRNNPR